MLEDFKRNVQGNVKQNVQFLLKRNMFLKPSEMCNFLKPSEMCRFQAKYAGLFLKRNMLKCAKRNMTLFKENSEDIFSFGSALEDFICVVFVPDRNIVLNPIISFVSKSRSTLRRLAMSSDNESSAVPYSSISFDSDGPSWGIPLVNADKLLEWPLRGEGDIDEDSIDYPDEPEDDKEDLEEDDDEDLEEDPEEDPNEEHEPEDEDTKEKEPSEVLIDELFEEDRPVVTPPTTT
ncbi:hypothetical protein Tco_0685380 [Tanacetum coccineum]